MCGGGNSFLEGLLNVGVQMATYGTVGYKDDRGGFGTGVTQQILDGKKQGTELNIEALPGMGIIKDLTGASAAEDANTLARDQFEKKQAEALQNREDAKAQTAAEQLSISRQASSLRSGRGTPTGSRFSNVGADERDFLGL